MGLFDDIFGGGETTSFTAPSLFRTVTSGGSEFKSALTPEGLKFGVQLNKDIHGLRGEQLSGVRSLLQQVRGNQGSLIQAATRPLIDQQAAAVGGLRRDLGRRNVTGTLANNEISNVERKFGVSIGDAAARATDSSARLEGNLLESFGNISNRLAEDEFQAFNLGQSAFSSAIGSRGQKTSDDSGFLGEIGEILDLLGI
jgi:hypothetical protein